MVREVSLQQDMVGTSLVQPVVRLEDVEYVMERESAYVQIMSILDICQAPQLL